MRSVVVEFTFDSPKFLTQANPVVCDVITNIMFFLRHTKHGDFALIPTSNDVEAKPAARNMIDGGDFLSRSHRMDCRHVKGCEHTDFLGFCREASGPGECLEITVIKIHGAAHAFPTRHWNNRFDTRFFCE